MKNGFGKNATETRILRKECVCVCLCVWEGKRILLVVVVLGVRGRYWLGWFFTFPLALDFDRTKGGTTSRRARKKLPKIGGGLWWTRKNSGWFPCSLCLSSIRVRVFFGVVCVCVRERGCECLCCCWFVLRQCAKQATAQTKQASNSPTNQTTSRQ